MIIYNPLQSSFKSQGFGENKACLKVDANGVPYRKFRVVGTIGGVCPINSVPFYKAIGMEGHNGWDVATYFKSPCFFPVIAACKWKAKNYVDYDGGIGTDMFSTERINIDVLPKQAGTYARKEWKEHNGFMFVKFRFHHAYNNVIDTGDDIHISQLIQLSDSTGASSGHHLHWSMKFVDKNGVTLDTASNGRGSDNGYYGAVDFSRWYNDTFILDLFEKKPKLTAEQTLRMMAWHLRHIDRKGAEILRAVAQIVSAFGTKVGGILLVDVKKK